MDCSLSEDTNCMRPGGTENVDGYNTLVQVLCALVVILHIKLYFDVGSTIRFGFFALIANIAMIPILLVTCCVSSAYRLFVKNRLQKSPGFCGLLDGSDSFWACDQTCSRSIINVLFMMDFSEGVKEGRKPIEIMRKRMKRVAEEASFKFKCKMRLSEYGYYYFEKYDVDINEHVRDMEPEVRSKADLEKFASEVANEPIVGDHLWEVLVGREELDGSHPVMIRIHHSMGDGYSIVRLFIDHLSDKDTAARCPLDSEEEFGEKYGKNIFGAVGRAFGKIITYIYVPHQLAALLLPPPDRNSLHSRLYLSGKKVCRLARMDLEFMKDVRRAARARFTDVLFMAVSDSLETCFSRWGETVDRVSAVVPSRLPGRTEGMTNSFTIGLLELPIIENAKMKWIKRNQDLLKNPTDYYVNYWVTRAVFTIFPATMVSKYVVSTQSTVSLSNVPGPNEYLNIEGCKMTDMAFFLPHRDTTGVGISFLSYVDKFNIGVTVDESLLSSPDQADEILEGIVESLRKMHNAPRQRRISQPSDVLNSSL